MFGCLALLDSDCNLMIEPTFKICAFQVQVSVRSRIFK